MSNLAGPGWPLQTWWTGNLRGFHTKRYNVLGVPIAAGVLYPVLGLLLSPMIASAAMTLSSVSVIANALRLRHLRL